MESAVKLCDKINHFCYVCGQLTPSIQRIGLISDELREAYRHYFNGKVILFENWSPSIVCKSCYNRLLDWKYKKRERMPFGTPMDWYNPIEHDPENCYACKNYKRRPARK